MINTGMFCGGVHSFQSLSEVARCCNAFLNAISHVYSHTPTHGYSMAHVAFVETKELKDYDRHFLSYWDSVKAGAGWGGKWELIGKSGVGEK